MNVMIIKTLLPYISMTNYIYCYESADTAGRIYSMKPYDIIIDNWHHVVCLWIIYIYMIDWPNIDLIFYIHSTLTVTYRLS